MQYSLLVECHVLMQLTCCCSWYKRPGEPHCLHVKGNTHHHHLYVLLCCSGITCSSKIHSAHFIEIVYNFMLGLQPQVQST